MSESSKLISSNLNEKEIVEAKKNGFILTGITGAGKTTLLNILLGDDIGIVKKSAESVTKTSTVYCYKDSKGKLFSIIDTPGLKDTSNDEKVEQDHLKSISTAVTKHGVQVKGILFLINFQKERLDRGEQEALLSYNQLFPLKRFWSNIIIIYTHYYGCEDGDSLDEMKNERKETNKKLFDDIMEKVKNVSDVVDYDKLNIQYFNSFSPLKEDKTKRERQKKTNNKNKNNLEKELEKISENEPLFRKVEIALITNFPLVLKEIEYLAEIKLMRFYDLNNEKPIKENIYEIVSKKEIKKKNYIKPEPKLKQVEVIEAVKNENDELSHKIKVDNETSSTAKEFKSKGIGAILGGLAGLATGCFLLSGGGIILAVGAAGAAVGVGGAALISKIFN